MNLRVIIISTLTLLQLLRKSWSWSVSSCSFCAVSPRGLNPRVILALSFYCSSFKNAVPGPFLHLFVHFSRHISTFTVGFLRHISAFTVRFSRRISIFTVQFSRHISTFTLLQLLRKNSLWSISTSSFCAFKQDLIQNNTDAQDKVKLSLHLYSMETLLVINFSSFCAV